MMVSLSFGQWAYDWTTTPMTAKILADIWAESIKVNETVGIGITPDVDMGISIAHTATVTATENGLGMYINPTFTEAASGVHTTMAGAYINGFTVNNNVGSTTTNIASLYIADAPTGATATGGTNYAIQVASGNSYFGSSIEMADDAWLKTSTANMFRYNSTLGGIEVGSSLLLGGSLEAELNSGAVMLADMQVSSAASAATEMSFSVGIDSDVIGKFYAESDGSGSIQNESFIIPTGDFDVTAGDATFGSNVGIGGAVDADVALQISRSFTGSGAANVGGISIEETAQLGIADSYEGIFISPTITEAASGVHGTIAGVYVNNFTVTGGTATNTNLAGVYVAGAPIGTATNNYSIFVDADDVRFDEDLSVGGYVTKGTEHHAYGGFQDSAITVAATVDTWTPITNATETLWALSEADGFTDSGDTLTITNTGDYNGSVAVTFSGGNTDDYLVRLYNVTQAAVEGFHIGVTTAGTSNFANVSLPIYIENTAGDKYVVQIMNTTDSDDPIVRSGIFQISYVHE